jgi:hypothetical protein
MSNYTYPSGLHCNVSESRIKLFEYLVIPLIVLILFWGSIAIVEILDMASLQGHMRLMFGLLGVATWFLICPAIAYGLFLLICKPVFGEKLVRVPTKLTQVDF